MEDDKILLQIFLFVFRERNEARKKLQQINPF